MEKISILHAKTDIKNIHPCNGWIFFIGVII